MLRVRVRGLVTANGEKIRIRVGENKDRRNRRLIFHASLISHGIQTTKAKVEIVEATTDGEEGGITEGGKIKVGFSWMRGLQTHRERIHVSRINSGMYKVRLRAWRVVILGAEKERTQVRIAGMRSGQNRRKTVHASGQIPKTRPKVRIGLRRVGTSGGKGDGITEGEKVGIGVGERRGLQDRRKGIQTRVGIGWRRSLQNHEEKIHYSRVSSGIRKARSRVKVMVKLGGEVDGIAHAEKTGFRTAEK